MITNDEIHKAVWERGARPAFSFWDSGYSCPTMKWVDHTLGMAFRQRIFVLGLVWRTEKSDCNTFALECMSHARQCHLKSEGSGQLAFGMMLYYTKEGVYHAINIYIERQTQESDGSLIPVALAYEPQIQKTVELTEDEWKSCTHVFF